MSARSGGAAAHSTGTGTKADGTHATVLFDANFAITETQDQGQGGPGGGHGGPGDADSDDATGGSTSNG